MTDTFFLLRGLPTIIKAPGEVLAYTVDFTDWLDGLVITSCEVTGPGVTIAGASVVGGGKAITATISGGVRGSEALVDFTAVGEGFRRTSTIRLMIERRP